MMEFTYDGVVRQSFGFYNPNHAAALICAVMPFLWGWRRRWTWVGWSLSIALLVPLALTYSRTGFVVLVLELIGYFILTKCKNWKLIVVVAGAVLGAMVLGGVLLRFTLDRSILNRPEIWWAGLKLCSVNPLGVGFGNSGLLASTFLLDGIECRTLVNSHLTLWSEQGIFVAFVWFSIIFYAISNIKRRPRIGVAFVGLCLSASCASIFDWGVLFDFAEYGKMGLQNFIQAWIMFILFGVLGASLMIGKTRWQRVGIPIGIAGLFVIVPLLFPCDAPKIRHGHVVRDAEPQVFVMYDEDWTLKNVLDMLNGGYVLPLRPREVVSAPPGGEVWLFGAMVECAGRFDKHKIVLVDPPEFFTLPPNTTKVLIPRFPERTLEGTPVEFY